MTTARQLAATLCLFIPFTVAAHNFNMGERVAPVGIADKGELVLQQDKLAIKTGTARSCPGKCE